MLSILFCNETDAKRIKKKFVFILSIMAILSFNNICGSGNTKEMSKHHSNFQDERQTYLNSIHSGNLQICRTDKGDVHTSQKVNASSSSILKRTDQMPQEANFILPLKKRKFDFEFYQPMNLQPEGLVSPCVLGNGVNPSISCNHSHPYLSSASIDTSGTSSQISRKISEVSFEKEKNEVLLLSKETKDDSNLLVVNGNYSKNKTAKNHKDSSPQLCYHTKIGRYKKSLISNKLKNEHMKLTINKQIKMNPVPEKYLNFHNYQVALDHESKNRTVNEKKFDIENLILSSGSIHDLSARRITKMQENLISDNSYPNSLPEDHRKTYIQESSSSIQCDTNNNKDDALPPEILNSQKVRENFLDDLKYLSSTIVSTHGLRILIMKKNLQLDEQKAKLFTVSVSQFKNQTDLLKPFLVKKNFDKYSNEPFKILMDELHNIYLYKVYPLYFEIIQSLDMDPFFYNFSKFLYCLKMRTLKKTKISIFDIKMINDQLKIIVNVPDCQKSSYALAILHMNLFLIKTVNIRETKLKIFNVAEIDFNKNVSQFLDDKKYENLISLSQMKKYTELLDFLYYECKSFIKIINDAIYERLGNRPQTYEYFKEQIRAIAARNIRKKEETMKWMKIVDKKPENDKSKIIRNSNQDFFTFLDHILTKYPKVLEYLQNIIDYKETAASKSKTKILKLK